MLLLCVSTAAGYSQGTFAPKPKIFSNFPNVIALSETTLRNAFTAIDGQDISLQLSSNFNFSGVVISNEIKYSNLRSIVIKSGNYNDAIFHLSEVTNDDNSLSYVGRILNSNAFDGFEIKKDATGKYSFHKFETQRILEDCSQ